MLNKISEAHPEVIARMKEVESYYFNLLMVPMMWGTTCQIHL